MTPGIPLGPIADADNPPTAFGLADVDAVLAGLGVQAIVRLFGDVAAVPGVDPAVSNFLSATYKVRCDPATDLDQATADLLALADVVDAVADTYVEITAAIPNDPLYLTSQDGLWRTRASGAWGAGQIGSAGVTVAFVDTGVDLAHPDLAGRIAGGVDVLDPPPVDPGAPFQFVGQHGANPADDVGHGTMIAGVIGAATNNSIGIAGVTHVGPLMPIRALGRAIVKATATEPEHVTGIAGATSLYVGIFFAVQNGARIVNVSAGGHGQHGWQKFTLDLVRGRVLIAAGAGNENGSAAGGADSFFPAAHDAVVSVGAIFSDGRRWVDNAQSGSNSRKHVRRRRARRTRHDDGPSIRPVRGSYDARSSHRDVTGNALCVGRSGVADG